MNKFEKIILSILGGMDVLITIATPIFLILVWLSIFGIKGHWSSYILLGVGWGACVFRAIKIGWLRK